MHTNIHTYIQTDRHTHTHTHTRTRTHTHTHTYKNKHTNKRTNERTNKQRNKETKRQTINQQKNKQWNIEHFLRVWNFKWSDFFFVFGTLFGRKKVALLNPFRGAKPMGTRPMKYKHKQWNTKNKQTSKQSNEHTIHMQINHKKVKKETAGVNVFLTW